MHTILTLTVSIPHWLGDWWASETVAQVSVPEPFQAGDDTYWSGREDCYPRPSLLPLWWAKPA